MTLRSQHIIVVRVGAALALWLFSLQASAQEVPNKPEWYLELGVGRTDNLNRDPDELESDIGKVGVGFAGRTDRRWLRAALGGDLEYRRYEIDSSEEPLEDDDEVLGTAGLQLELHAIPDRIQWDFRADYGQSRIDPLGAVGPSNRQRTTSYATGPKFGLPLGSRTLLKLGGEVADQEFEVTQDLDGRSTNILLELERQLDEVTKISLVGDKREIEYDLDGQMHDIESLMLKYNRELASGEALVSIGAGRVSVNGVEADPVAVGQLVWKRDVGVRSGFEICVGREITDAGSAFESAGVAIGCPGDLSSLESVARTATNREQGVVVDIRSKEDFRKGHITDAVHILPSDIKAGNLGKLENQKSNPIIVVCQTGQSSQESANLLAKGGFENVSLLKNGLIAWNEANLPLVKGKK